MNEPPSGRPSRRPNPHLLFRRPGALGAMIARAPISCVHCYAADVYCFECQERHPIRAVENGVHVAYCGRGTLLHRPCEQIPAPTPTPAGALAPDPQPLPGVLRVGVVCFLLGFILGAVIATGVWGLVRLTTPSPAGNGGIAHGLHAGKLERDR